LEIASDCAQSAQRKLYGQLSLLESISRSKIFFKSLLHAWVGSINLAAVFGFLAPALHGFRATVGDTSNYLRQNSPEGAAAERNPSNLRSRSVHRKHLQESQHDLSAYVTWQPTRVGVGSAVNVSGSAVEAEFGGGGGGFTAPVCISPPKVVTARIRVMTVVMLHS
jgi:hypothetical protein